VASTFKEGDPVRVEGTLSLRHWQKRTGAQRSSLSVASTNIEAPLSDVASQRARHADAEVVLGQEA
jgi:single-stranded DNA-binding protein